MGCDIHAYLDVTEGEPDPERDYAGWIQTFAHDIPIGRDYALFGLLAGVRGGKALIEPRGLPEYDQMGWRTRDTYWLRVTDSPSCGWCGECKHVSPSDAEKWRGKTIKIGDETYVQNPDVLIILSQEAYTKYGHDLPAETLLIIDPDLVKPDSAMINQDW